MSNMVKSLPTLVILYAGSPLEHEVSKASAATIYKAAVKKYNIELIFIDKDGRWLLPATPYSSLDSNPKTKGRTFSNRLATDGEELKALQYLGELKSKFGENVVVFPALHGHWGEDGTIQSLLQSFDIAFVGAGVETSKNCIDKSRTKKILQDCGIEVTPYYEIKQK